MSLNKAQQREVFKTLAALPVLGKGYGARVISSLYRSAMKQSQKEELLKLALAYGLVSDEEFIV